MKKSIFNKKIKNPLCQEKSVSMPVLDDSRSDHIFIIQQKNIIQGYSHCINLEADVVAAIEDKKTAAKAEMANLEEAL